jgi:hypothetical protein
MAKLGEGSPEEARGDYAEHVLSAADRTSRVGVIMLANGPHKTAFWRVPLISEPRQDLLYNQKQARVFLPSRQSKRTMLETKFTRDIQQIYQLFQPQCTS